MEINVLDKGFVRLVDTMGTDESIVEAARVSYASGTKQTRNTSGLIRYLMRHKHTSPFEMCEIKLHIKAPLFVARQWLRHRTANVNEISGRYSVLDNEYYLPSPNAVKTQSRVKKQCSASQEYPNTQNYLRDLIENKESTFKLYHQYIEDGVAREQARIVLPLSTYTEFYWKIDAHNLMRFLHLRMGHNSQYEIREYANAIFKILKNWLPITTKAFEDFILNSVSFSTEELEVLLQIINLEELKELINNSDLQESIKREFIEKIIINI